MILPKPESRRRRQRTAALGAIVLAGVSLFLTGNDRSQLDASGPRVTKGNFRSTILLTGTLVSLRAEEFKVPIIENWRVQIKWMVKEGESVKPGDPVVRFDTANLASDIETAQDSLRTKREEKAQKEADYQHQKFELDVEVRKAENDNRQKEIDAAIPPGLEAKYEYDRKQLDKKRSDFSLESARTNRMVKLAEGESQIKTLEIEVRDLEAKLENLKNNLSALTLTADTAGAVLYAVDEWSGRKVQVGDTVYSTYVVAQIPDMSSLKVQALISETHIQHINIGESVDLSLDAYPDKHYRGVIGEISKSAETVRRWGRSHYFRVQIEMEKLDQEIMRPGMSVKCEVQGPQYDDVLLVPLEMTLFDGQSFWIRPARGEPLKLKALGFNEFLLAVGAGENSAVKPGLPLAPVGVLKETRETKADETKK
ncbi:MAG: HlyD family efflux transporter periplasmic adaptor subunit [Candidatus Aminicenantales bacterium]|jgi:multidrug efflux pump subunit AcrA (membrane-fusion protein)